MKTYNVPSGLLIEAHKRLTIEYKQQIEQIAPDLFPQKVRLTLEDIAKLKGVDVSLIEIVK